MLQTYKIFNVCSNNYIEYESNGDKDKNLLIEKYVSKIKPYLKDTITDLQKSDTRKIQLTILINFIPSKDTNEKLTIHSES